MAKLERAKTGPLVVVALLAGVVTLGTAGANTQPAAPAPPPAPAHAEPAPAQSGANTAPATPGASQAAQAGEHAAPAGAQTAAAPHGSATGEHGEAHGESIWVTLSRIANFAILAGILYWFGRKPIADHLAARGAQIRKDLVDAAEMRATATARLSEIEAKLAALPDELEQMRARSTQELEAERTRIRELAEAERDRLVQQARREIASQTRNARAELRAHAATLAVDVADARLRSTLTAAEQSALVDKYVGQMRNVQ